VPDTPTRSPLTLPVALDGHFKRDWRLSRALVGKGHLELTEQGVVATAGSTGPVRSLLVLVVRVIALLGFAAGCAAAVLTAIGLTVRTHTPQWLASVLVAIPTLWAGSLLLVALSRRFLERRRTWRIRWSQVERIGVPRGPFIELSAQAAGGRLVGRFRPRRFTRDARLMLAQLRAGAAPLSHPTVQVAPLRSRRIDQAVLLVAGGLAGAGLWLSWPRIAPVLAGPPTHGPAAGVPARADAALLEQAHPACARGPADGPAVRNHRVGDDLAWTRDERDQWSSVHLTWRPDQGVVQLAGSDQTHGRLAGAFAGDAPVAAFSLSVPADRRTALEAALRGDGLQAGLCSGDVARIDRARAPGEGEQDVSLDLHRDGDDLVVEVQGRLPRGTRLLAARQRDQSRLDWFDRCELAVVDDTLVLPRARALTRLADFFGSSRDAARAVLVAPGKAGEVRSLLSEDAAVGAVDCIDVDALTWLDLGLAWATTARSDGLLAEAAADLARQRSVTAAGTAEALVSELPAAYAAVLADLSPRGRAEAQAVDQGFLDGLPWGRVLDRLSMQHDLATIERVRQRLSGADPVGNLGELFLLRLAEELLERIPPDGSLDAYNSRIDVAEDWLDITAGKTWVSSGRKITVPSDEVAAYYQVVGHYLLVDVARRAERRMARDLVFRVTGLPLRWRLENHGINLDVEKSTTQKALEAWVKGDFEYLGDRALAKLAEKVTDQADVIAAASGASYRLDGQWSAGDGAARTATLLRDGREIGWVSLYDQDAVALHFHNIGARGTSRQALGGGHPVLLATAGSYVTADLKTSGLSAVDGSIDNFLISNKMDGLVIIDAAGRLATLDMRAGGPLPGESQPIQPLEHLADLHRLLAWLQDHDASAFQTHLLGYGGQLTIDEATASPTLRERRLLVQAAYRGHPIVAVVDLPGSPKVTLFEAAIIAIQALRTPEQEGGPGLDVVAVANLDVGSYNALTAWTDGGQVLRQSWKPLGETMNLVSIRRR